MNPNEVSIEGRGESSALRRIVSLPALRSLAIQCLCLPPTLAAVWLLARAGAAPGYLHVALVQGLFAAMLSAFAGQARWWRFIQFAFPVAVLAAHNMQVPPGAFLAAFLLLLVTYWSTFRTQVPYYPSGPGVRALVAALVPATGSPRVIDIGSGLGGLVLDLARACPHARVEGIELAPLPWLASRIRAAVAGSRARFVRGDYEHLDFGKYDLVFAYLSPAAMDGLWRKARREMRPGSRLASYEFAIEGRTPDECFVPEDSPRKLYVWKF